MSVRKIYQGENGVIRWPLLQKDGSPLPIEDLTLLYVEFIQNNRVKQRYTYTEEYMERDPEIRICEDDEDGTLDISGGNVLEVEYTTALTERLSRHPTFLKVTAEGPSTVMQVDGVVHSEWRKQVFWVL